VKSQKSEAAAQKALNSLKGKVEALTEKHLKAGKETKLVKKAQDDLDEPVLAYAGYKLLEKHLILRGVGKGNRSTGYLFSGKLNEYDFGPPQ
jgi:hypothetical protein